MEIGEKNKLLYAMFAIFNEMPINYQYPYYLNSIELNEIERTEEDLNIKIKDYFTKLELIKQKDNKQNKDLDKENQLENIVLNLEEIKEIKDIKENKLDKIHEKKENDKKIKFSQNLNKNINCNKFLIIYLIQKKKKNQIRFVF